MPRSSSRPGSPASTPLVTCVVCAYNYARYLPAALDSALAQTHRNLELLVVDDGSTDETPDVLAAYGDRIRVVRQENAGLNAATARGIEEARGELVAILDADDVWQPEKLARQVQLLRDRPRVGLVFSDMETMDADGQTIASSYFGAHGMAPPRGRALGAFLQENFAPAPTIVFRRELASHVLPVAHEASFQDWWLALRVAEVAEIDFVDEPLVRYRVHGDNMASGADGARWLANVRRDNGFRRWMLANLDLSSVTLTDLRRAWIVFEAHSALVASRAGHDVAAEYALQGRDPEAADRLLVGGEPLAALCADPLHADARRAALLDRSSDPPTPTVPDPPVRPMPSTAVATPYVPEYFDDLQRGSLRSARTILPMLFEAVAPRSVLDIGCGVGTWLAAACELGAEIVGVDGDYVDRARLLIDAAAFVPADLEQALDLGRRFDVVTTLEVAEHLEPSAADTFVATLVRHGDVVLFSAATPGQGGEHHVNEQWPAYWAQRFAAHGYVATDPLRARCWLDESVEPWYAQNVLVFVRRERLASFPVLAAAVAPGGVPLPLVHPRLFLYAVQRAAAGAPVSEEPQAAAAADVDPVLSLGAFVTVAHVDEVIAEPELLAAYASRFTAQDDATLVLYAPDSDATRVAAELAPVLAATGMDRTGAPDAMLLSVPCDEGDVALAGRASAVLTRRAPRAALSSVMHTGPEATPLLGALAAGALTSPARPDGLGAELLEAVVTAAGAPDVEDNVDRIRFPEGQGTPTPGRIPGLLAEQIEASVLLEPLWDRLDPGSRQVLVSLMAYKVLGWRKVRMPVGPFAQLRRIADQIRDVMLREEATGAIAFLDWQLDRYDLGVLGMPIELHSHPWLIINEFVLDQYRAPEPAQVAVRPGDVVIDGGGCWGETSLHFAHLAGPEGRVETFEFDPSNLETLRRNLALNPELAERVHVHPHPLWHTAGERLTYDSNGPGTRVGTGGAGPGVETRSIDELVASSVVERIDFVKLDVEGAELSVLRGAGDALRRFRPRLAIAAYHKADDLVMLPAFLDELRVGYRFAIGHYTMALEETVLFAWCDDDR